METVQNPPNNLTNNPITTPQSKELNIAPGSSRVLNKIKYNLTPEEMWTTIHGTNQNWGIEGYEVPRQYYDYHQVKWAQERKKILDSHKRVWPPTDWPKDKETDKPVKPIRKNFIDDYIKWATSFNDPKRSDEIKESLESRGCFRMPEPKKPMNLREKFLKEEKEKKEKMANIPKIYEWKTNSIEQAQIRIDEAKAKEKTQFQKDKERYTKEKPQWPRCDRVTIVADAEYCGEQVPFYKTYKKEGEEIDKNKLFFPSTKFTSKYRTDPKWSFRNKNPTELPTVQMKSKEDLHKEKIDNYKSSKGVSDKDLLIDVPRAYELVKKRGRYPITFHKPFDYAGTDQYKTSKEQRPEYSPAPTHYWKMKDIDSNTVPKELVEEKEVNGRTMKVYYMNHKRTDFREYKPMRKSIY
jgi:hypothetical protein